MTPGQFCVKERRTKIGEKGNIALMMMYCWMDFLFFFSFWFGCMWTVESQRSASGIARPKKCDHFLRHSSSLFSPSSISGKKEKEMQATSDRPFVRLFSFMGDQSLFRVSFLRKIRNKNKFDVGWKMAKKFLGNDQIFTTLCLHYFSLHTIRLDLDNGNFSLW